MFFSCFANSNSPAVIKKNELKLVRAVCERDLATVKALKKANTPLDFTIPQYWTYKITNGYARMPAPCWINDLPFVHYVAMMADYDLEILKFILISIDILQLTDQHANLNITRINYELSGDDKKYSGSILHNTQMVHDFSATFDMLIQHGADVNAVNSSGVSVVSALLRTTPFYNSDSNSNSDRTDQPRKKIILNLYVKNHAVLNAADVNALIKLMQKDKIDATSVDILFNCVSHNIAQSMLDTTEPKAINDLSFAEQGSLLHFLATKTIDPIYDDSDKFLQLINLVIGISDLNIRDKNGRTALSIAAELSPLVFNAILAQKDENGALKANIELADNNGLTPLMHAIKSWENFNTLINLDANIDARDNKGASVCHHAVNTRCLEVLLTKGAEFDVSDNDGATVCHYAANSFTLDLLLKHKAKCDVPDKNGVTPLMLALQNKNIRNAGLLIGNGANIWAKASENRTPIDFARQDPHTLTYLNTVMLKAQHEAMLDAAAPHSHPKIMD